MKSLENCRLFVRVYFIVQVVDSFFMRALKCKGMTAVWDVGEVRHVRVACPWSQWSHQLANIIC